MIKNINSMFKLKTSFEIILMEKISKLINIGGSSLNIYDISSNELLAEFKDLKNPSHICISNNNNEIGLINSAGRIAIYDLMELKNIRLDKKNKPETCNILFTPDDKYLVFGDWDGNIYIFDKINTTSFIIAQYKNSMIQSINQENNIYYFLVSPKANEKSGKIEDFIKVIEWKYPFNLNKSKDKRYKINSSDIMKFKSGFLILDDQLKSEILIINYDKNTIITKLHYEGVLKYFSLSNNLNYFCFITDDKVNLYNYKDFTLIKVFELKYACFVNFSNNDDYIILGSWNNGLVLKIEDFLNS
jgi:hypothetical protein